MNSERLSLVALAALSLLLSAASHKPHRRRSLVAQAQNLPVSKGGWRPVVGSGGLLYGSLNTAPLHSSYLYHSSARPLAARDVNKLTSIAQSYRPTTLRTVPVTHTLQPNQPINSYFNPFALPNNLNHYKFLQNYPIDNMFYRTPVPHNPYSARPVLKNTKQKQYHNNILQQLSNIQPMQFGQYGVPPVDIYGKIDYSRPDGKRPQSADTEIFKPEVYKLPDSDTASQFIAQPVKTAQQQTLSQKIPINQYGHPFQDNVFNMQQQFPNIIGTFGSFGLQSVKGRDHLNPSTKTTYLPPQPTKQTIFNSFNYSPNFKTTSALFSSTTPKLQTTQNHLIFGSTFNDLGNVPTPHTKLVSPLKIDPNAGIKHYFKPSPQDHYIKNFHTLDFNKITTYNPNIVQTTTQSAHYNDYGYQSHNSQNYDDPETVNINYDKTKHKVSDNVGLTQQVSHQYTNAPGMFDQQSSLNAQSYHPTYAVEENVSEDVNTHTPPAWTVTPQSYVQASEESVTKPEITNNIFEKPTTVNPEAADEYAIVTEGQNNFNYESHMDTQSRRPLGDDFEPIGKTKLKEYYYKVSTPSYNDHKPYRRTKKPNSTPKQEATTQQANKDTNDATIETLPTLPPSLHFKRPSASEPLVDNKVRKRNKIRRRRPINRNREETTTRKDVSTDAATTTSDEIPTIRPRVRPIKTRTESSVTTPTVTTDLTTSALPTTSATKPTIVKKKLLGHRRPLTTPSDKIDTTTQAIKEQKEQDYSKESPIMKISSRPHSSKVTSTIKQTSESYKTSEIPDYSHKQDEKDTPTSDISVSLTDLKDFSFHRDARPVGIKETTTESVKETEPTTIAPRTESDTRTTTKILRPRLKSKLDRPKFSVKDYRSRLNSTTSTTEKVIENTPKVRFPQRKNPYETIFSDVETTTERKKFTPKEPRHKLNKTENNEQEIHSRHNRPKQTDTEVTTQKSSSRVRNGQRRPKPNEDSNETTSQVTVLNKRPLRKKIPDSENAQSVQDITVAETTPTSDLKNDATSERTRSESAIMKIADKKHQDHIERLFEHSKRVSDLTLAASKDYNTPGLFKTVSSNSRRIPSYFTIATDDPILPIEAFFPQLNQKKE